MCKPSFALSGTSDQTRSRSDRTDLRITFSRSLAEAKSISRQKDSVDKEKEKVTSLEETKDSWSRCCHVGKIALENPDFLKRAPQEEVENRKQTLVQIQKKLQSLQRNLEGLS